MTLRVAFIGAGQMARHHARAISRLAVPATIVGVYDRVSTQSEEFAALTAARPFSSIDALLAGAQPDIVHVCTPPASHVEAALAALNAGANVYVEKPFALTGAGALALVDTARSRRRLVCAGHQLLHDPAFAALVQRAAGLGTITQADSHFSFRAPGVSMARASASALARQLLDILPHPLYSLIAVMERAAPLDRIKLAWAHATPADLQAILCAGEMVGRLSVSLRARPVASSLTLTGTGGSLTCDFMRSMVTGAGNPGTEVIEKILNPMVEGAGLALRAVASLPRRLRAGGGYPGLVELIGAFYHAVAYGGPSPVSPEHLVRVTDFFEELAPRVDVTAGRPARIAPEVPINPTPLVAVTGARGFLGAEVARALPCVRGIGRTGRPDNLNVHEWVTVDLSRSVAADVLAGADVVIHAAAETSGGYDAHQRNTIDATRHLLRAMHMARVSRLVLVSSLSVVRPPRTSWELQDERTERPRDPRPLGPYTWGKCLQEEVVEREAAALGIATRIVRPAALIDRSEPDLPGLAGRRLFGRWHLGLGRPGLPIAVCDVKRAAEVIAWCATHFDEAPSVVNLIDPAVNTRRALLAELAASGWSGRMLWVPISFVAFGVTTARTLLALARGRWPTRLAAWSVLRPRHYATRLSAQTIETARQAADAAAEHRVAVLAGRRTA